MMLKAGRLREDRLVKREHEMVFTLKEGICKEGRKPARKTKNPGGNREEETPGNGVERRKVW